jgi:hypothetical protein
VSASTKRAALLLAVVCSTVAGAQMLSRPVTSSTFDATRAELTHRLDSLQRVDSTKGKAKDRQALRNEIAALRTRLTQGDLQAGDRFLVDYGDPTRRADTVLVRDSSDIAMFNWPSASVRGVLNSELQVAVEKYVGKFVREPRLRVYPLTRLTFTGGFGRPGVYAVDPKRPLSDAINQAGGTGTSSKGDRIAVYRGDKKVLDSKSVALAVQNGSTVEDLGLLSGDQLRVPVDRQSRDWRQLVQPVILGVSVMTALLAIIRASYAP